MQKISTAARIDVVESLFAAQEVKRSAAFGTSLSEDERAQGKVEGEEGLTAGELCLRRTPVKAAGDHEMNHEPEITVDTDGDALADAAEGTDGFSLDRGNRRIDGAEDKDAGKAHVFECCAKDARLEGGDVGGDVGEFRH